MKWMLVFGLFSMGAQSFAASGSNWAAPDIAYNCRATVLTQDGSLYKMAAASTEPVEVKLRTESSEDIPFLTTEDFKVSVGFGVKTFVNNSFLKDTRVSLLLAMVGDRVRLQTDAAFTPKGSPSVGLLTTSDLLHEKIPSKLVTYGMLSFSNGNAVRISAECERSR
jgi:hypothetical protein